MSSPDRIETLLLHDGFVRSLARSLLADPHAAEDVAQETWVAALQGGASAASLPRWLSGVVRNLAGKARRGSQRREKREHGAARAEATPSGEEILEREAARSRVVAAVLALEEPYRATVLLRYFEGLPPRTIAARQDTPVETVRTRLKRALEVLRARLDREYGGDGKAWGTALLPLARPPTAVLAPLSALAATLPALLAASVGALALAGLYLLVVHAREAPVEATAPMAAVASVEAPRPVRGVVDEPAASSTRSAMIIEKPSSAPALATATGSLRVHATWSDGTPAAGIHARIESWELESPAFRALDAWTDENGDFALEQVPCGNTWVTLDRDCSGQVEVEVGAEATLALEIPRGFDLEGLVVDREGAAVPGADLWLSNENEFTGTIVGRSRADGSFHLRSCTHGHSIGARSAGHAPSLLVGLKGNEGTVVSVRLVLLGAGGEVEGRVHGPGGEPVAGATVLVGAEMNGFLRVFVAGEGELTGQGAAPALVRTDEDGHFQATGIAPGRTPVAVRADGLALWRGTVQVSEQERATLDVQLVEEARLTGHVRDGQGQPVASARVQLQNCYGRLDPHCLTRSDGSFRLEGLAPGALLVTAEADEKGRASTMLEAKAGDELTWEGQVGLGLELRGRVFDEEGRPLAGWHVEIQDELRANPPDLGSGRTDGDGRFLIVGLHDRPHRVELEAPGEAGTFASSIVGGICPGAEEQLFRVADADVPSARLRGFVVDELGNVPTNLQLELQSLDLGRSKPLQADEQGRFELGPYAPGTFVLRVRAQGHPEHLLGPRGLTAGETWDCGVIELHTAGALVVRVQRAPGTEALEPWFRILRGTFDHKKLEPAGEAWRCEALAPGSWKLKMAGTGVAAALVPFEIRKGETTELELPLRPGLHREIRVAVTAEVGARRPRLRLTSTAGDVVLEEEMWGRLPREFQHHGWLAPGRYRVEIELGDGPRAEAELEVAAGVPEAEPLLLTLP